jgi:hypothetical protein
MLVNRQEEGLDLALGTWSACPAPQPEQEEGMYARVVRWEGADAEAMKESVEQIRADADSGPPDGLPAKKLWVLHDLEGGKAMAITLFENEEDYRQGDATLNSMSPPGEGMGRRVAVDKYELAIELEA